MSATVEAPDRPEGAADDPLSDEAREAIEAAEFEKAAAEAEARHASGEPGPEPSQDPMSSAYGPASQLTLLAGGEAPSTSEFKLAGRSIEIPGQFAKGSTSVLTIGVQWGAVEFVDKLDNETGQVVETIRRHKGKIVAYELLPENDDA
jgi:hypothetical protein